MFALDIETVPTDAALALPYPEADRPVPGNYSKPESIAAWRVKDREAWAQERIKAFSLNPRLGRIVCVSLSVFADADALVRSDAHVTTETFLAWSGEDELEMLRAVASRLRRQCSAGYPCVTWNGAFDLRFLAVRGALHGLSVVPTELLLASQRPYNSEQYVDVKRAFTADVRTAGEGLDAWAAAFHLPLKPMDAASVYDAVRAERFDDVAAYCEHDAGTTLRLAARAYRGGLFR